MKAYIVLMSQQLSLHCFILSTLKDITNGSLNENDIDNDADSDLPSTPPAAATAQAVAGVSSSVPPIIGSYL